MPLAEPACDPQGADPWPLGNGRLKQCVRYADKTFGLRRRLAQVSDTRRKPTTLGCVVAMVIFYLGLLRIRSFNALEPKLRESPFLHLLGMPTGRALCSADTLARALRVADLDSVRNVSVGIVRKAERNKVFRAGWHAALRYVAIDGWEPICSYKRHCSECLVRRIRMDSKNKLTGEVDSVCVEQYYHRYVVAMLIDPLFDLVLDIEPLLSKDLRPPRVPKAGKFKGQPLQWNEDEGELTVATRLIQRVKQTYRWLDVVVADALYANGPFLTTLAQHGLGGVIVARKDRDEPLRGALRLWGDQAAQDSFDDPQRHEHVELWDAPGIETLSSYAGPIRVLRGRVTNLKTPKVAPKTWCLLVVGQATRLTARKALDVARGRWHIENTAFHQWTTRWKFDHVFVHHATGIRALYWLFFAAYNILTLFLYRQLGSYGRARGKDVTRTISRLVDEMLDDLARLTAPIHCHDTS